MTGSERMDLVDAVNAWTEQTEEELLDEDVEAILRLMASIDESPWSGVDVRELSDDDLIGIKAHLHDVEAPDYTAWVIDETLRELGITPIITPSPADDEPAPDEDPDERDNPDHDGDGDDEVDGSDDSDELDQGDLDATIDDAPDPDGTVDADLADEDADHTDLDNADEDAEPDDGDLDNETEPDLDDTDGGDDDETEPDDPDLDTADNETDPDLDTADNETEPDDPDEDKPDEDADTNNPDEDADNGGAPVRPGTFSAALSGEGDESDDALETASVADGPDSPPVGGGFAKAVGTDDEADSAIDDSFFDGLGPGWADDGSTPVEAAVGPPPLEFRESTDGLGPMFLPPATQQRSSRVALTLLAAAAVVAFVLAGIQLINSIDEGDDDTELVDAEVDGVRATTDDGQVDAASPATDSPSDDSDVDPVGETSEPLDDAAGTSDDAAPATDPEPTPTPSGPPPASRVLVRTDDGTVLGIGLRGTTIDDPTLLYGGAGGPAAAWFTVVRDGVAVVTESGDVEIVSTTGNGETTTLWSAAELGRARQIVQTGSRWAVLEATGSIAMFDADGPATADRISRPYDTASGGAPPARELMAFQDLVPFVLGNGDVQMVVTSIDGDPISPIWDGDTQPRAFNASINEHGLLMGVGEGAVASYRWFDQPPLTGVWDPFDGTRLPAIGYAGLESSTVIVLNNGSVANIPIGTTSGDLIWDAEVDERRATGVVASDDETLIILQDGGVERVDRQNGGASLGTVWDGADEALSPAVQVALLAS